MLFVNNLLIAVTHTVHYLLDCQIGLFYCKKISLPLYSLVVLFSFPLFTCSDSPIQPDTCTVAKMKRIETHQEAKKHEINSDSEIMKEKQSSGFVRLLTKKTENVRKPIKLKRKCSNSKQDEQKKDSSMTEQCDEECAVAKKSCPAIRCDDNCDSFESIDTVTRTNNNETANSAAESR